MSATTRTYAQPGTDGSDVLVFANGGGMLECCGCLLLTGSHSFETGTIVGIIAHLRAHTEAGHVVPASVIPTICGDAQVIFPIGTVPCRIHGRVAPEHECWRSQ